MNKYLFFLFTGLLLISCEDDDANGERYTPTPLEIEVPQLISELLPPPVIPEDNPQTVEGVSLGRKLFYETKLSADNTLSCAGCHEPSQGFSDERQFSVGIDGIAGTRNSMPLVNLAFNYNELFNWDGSFTTLEEQILEPVTNEIEMNNTWPNAVATLQADETYPSLFGEAFNTTTITKELVTKAIAQFLRTIVAGDSKFDRYQRGEIMLTPQELDGLDIFLNEDRGDCFHCHGSPSNPLWTDNNFHNNGLDANPQDRGFGLVTGDPAQFGWFKSPSLRNLAYTAPYMHDGRFATLDEVINHYSEGLVFSETIDPLMKSVGEGGVQLSDEDKAALKAFLLSLSDPSSINNPNYQNPN